MKKFVFRIVIVLALLMVSGTLGCIDSAPNQAVEHYNKGCALANEGRYDEAIAEYNKAIELDPEYAHAYTNRDFAIKRLTQASEYNRQGVTLASTGKNDEAIAAFSQALQVYPNYPSAYTNRGIVYIVKKQYTPAITDFNNAIELNPNYALAYSNRGLAYIYTERYEEAVADLDMSLQIDPDDDSAWNNRGVALEQLGELDAAEESFDTALKLDPSNENAKNNREVLQSGGRPSGGNVNVRVGSYTTIGEEAWEGTTDLQSTPFEEPSDGLQSQGGAGIQIKTLTGEWIDASPGYGLVTSASDGPSTWNCNVVLKLSETEHNTGGLHVQQPNTFTGSMQRTMRSITGSASKQPEFTSQIGKTYTHAVSGTRTGSAVDLYIDDIRYHLTFDGDDSLYGVTTTPGNPTWTCNFRLKRK